ncbi:MAG: HNH endonuclease signature motif containing protein [Pirellulaceae bacterium]
MAGSRRQRVWDRAEGRCEYCRMPQEFDLQPFQVDHIRAQKHSGATTAANLALSCLPCNSYKGANVAGYDPDDDQLQPLYNPRHDDWNEHFEWRGPVLRGKASVGRTTIQVLRINLPERVEHRRLLFDAGLLTFDDED